MKINPLCGIIGKKFNNFENKIPQKKIFEPQAEKKFKK